MDSITLSWIDYLVFSSLLSVSLLIGVYFCFWSKQDTSTDYLFGGKTMSYVPVGISLLSSFLSGITYVGLPSEVYVYGSKLMGTIIAIIGLGLTTNYLILPVFFKLQLPSTNAYLELRFRRSVKRLSSLIYILGVLTHMAILIYVPGLVLAKMANLNLHLVTLILTIICATYTGMGGVRAVVYTDTFQFFWTISGITTILIIGISSSGGIFKVWEIAQQGGRTIMFDMEPSIFDRNEFWTLTLGTYVTIVGNISIGQKYISKLLSIRREKDARKAMWLMVAGWIVITVMLVLTGITIYARYHGCDPLATNRVSKMDELLPYFVLDVAGHIPGLPGIFLAGIVSSALSTMSAGLNTLAGLIHDDFIKEWLPDCEDSERRATKIMRITVAVLAIVSIGLVYVIEQLGSIYQMITLLGSLVTGPLLALFILGMFFPWAGARGALTGGYSSLVIMMCYVARTQWHISKKHIRYTPLPTYVNECILEGTEAFTPTPRQLPPLAPEDEPAMIFRVSIWYFTLIGACIGIAIGLAVSWITGEMSNMGKVNPECISPRIKRFLPEDGQMDMSTLRKGT